MPFILVHSASFKQAIKLIDKATGVKIDFPGYLNIIKPDRINKPHAWDMVNSTGNIFDYIKNNIDDLESIIKTTDNPKFYVEPLVFINHYISDAMTIGQISSEFWGRIDDIIDARMELVINKSNDDYFNHYMGNPSYISTFNCQDITGLIDIIKEDTEIVYFKYGDEAKTLKFILGLNKDLQYMCKYCVTQSAIYTAAIFNHCYEWRIPNGKNS